jgi:integrase
MSAELPPGIERHGAVYRVRMRLGGGRVLRRSFDSLDAAERYLEAIRTERHAKRFAESSRLAGAGLSIMDITERWFAGRRSRLTPGVVRDYEDAIRVHISKIGSQSADDFARNPRKLGEFYDSLPPVRALRVHTILKQAFEEAVQHDELPRNPAKVVRPMRPPTKERLVPSPAEVAKIVIAAFEESPLWGLLVFIVATLGLRREEACALRSEDFDLDGKFVHVRRAVCKARGRPVIKTTKSGEPRRLPVGAEFMERVRPLLPEAGFLFQGFNAGYWKGGNPEEKCWHPDFASTRFRTTIRRLGLPPYGLHSLQHAVAVQLLVKGKPLTQVAKFMGHKHASITQDLYANHMDNAALRDIGETASTLVDPPVLYTDDVYASDKDTDLPD